MNRRAALRTAAAAGGLILTARSPAAELTADVPTHGDAPGQSPTPPRDVMSFFFRDWGTGTPVFFLHGWGLNLDFWQYQMVRLASRGCRCMGFDRRGHGRSSDPGRGYDYDTLAGDLAAMLARLDITGATLVGHSMGAGEIVRYLTKYGSGRVARIALVGATLPFLLKTPDNPQGVDRGFFDRWRGLLSSDFHAWAADNEAPFWAPDTPMATRAWGRQLGYGASLRALIECTHALTETDFRAELARLRLPVLLVHGGLDRSVPVTYARTAASLIPGARLVEYEDAPHALPVTHRARLNTELEQFIGAG